MHAAFGPLTPCLGTRLVKCVASQLKSVSAEPGNVPSLHSRAVRNVDAQSLPSNAPDLARLQLSGVRNAVGRGRGRGRPAALTPPQLAMKVTARL